MKEFTISDAEWKVMEVLWEKPNVTMKEITRLLTDSGWSYSTIKTLVLRLNKKGVIGADTTIGNFKYYPIALKDECCLKETKAFLDRIYGGSVKMLMAGLAGKSNLSQKEIEELMGIIDKMEAGEGK